MWQLCKIYGTTLMVWVCPSDLIDVVRKSGTLADGQVWGQIDANGPYRPCTPV